MSITIETVLSVDPDAVRRAQRLDHACYLLRNGVRPAEAVAQLRVRYSCSRATAWRIVCAARDLTETKR